MTDGSARMPEPMMAFITFRTACAERRGVRSVRSDECAAGRVHHNQRHLAALDEAGLPREPARVRERELIRERRLKRLQRGHMDGDGGGSEEKSKTHMPLACGIAIPKFVPRHAA
eukprot:4982427-Prymnesium_polylepis.2